MVNEHSLAQWWGSADLSWDSLWTVTIVLAVVLTVWFVGLAALAYGTRAGFVIPTAASQELGAETPALAHLVANRWECTEEAAEATFMDLAARGYLEIRGVGQGPEQAVCSIKDSWPPDLTPYERTVMSRVEQVAVSGSVPLPALAHGSPEAAQWWLRGFRSQVIDHARSLGISRSRISTTARVGLVSAAAVPSLIVGVVAARSFHHFLFATLGLGVFALLSASAWWIKGERDTELGRQVAARWLGMREYLELHPSFTEMAPTGVVMWGRYVAYAAALGVARQVLKVLELGPGDDHKAWSAYGGTWRKVRVRYPRWPFWGNHPSRAIASGIGWLAWAAAVIFLAREWLSQDWVMPLAVAVSGVATVIGLAKLVLGFLDLVMPMRLTGVVLRVRERKQFRPFARRYLAQRTRTYLAMDNGSQDKARAWVLAPDLRYTASEGDLARVKVGRFFGHVRDYERIKSSWEWRAEEERKAEPPAARPMFRLGSAGYDTPSPL